MKLSGRQLNKFPDTGDCKTIIGEASDFRLERFLPYEIRRFYRQVSSAVAVVYEKDYGITPAEWRVLATIGSQKTATAALIVSHAKTDKVTVSRALAKLVNKGWVKSSVGRTDRRQKNLSLTATGRRNYCRIVPKVLEAEQNLLAGVSQADIDTLRRVMSQIESNSEA